MISKRIVEYQGRQYVLHRFRSHSTFQRFMQIVQDMTAAGASVQSIAARTATIEQMRQHGYWVALDYVPGSRLGPDPAASTLISFGRSLARLHSVEGPEGRALFAAWRPKLPHVAYLLSTAGLSAAERDWVQGSRGRLRLVRANQLTHGDLYADNIIEAPDRSVSLIDYELMVFEQAGIELATALLRPFCRRAENRRLLVETYLAHCGEANAEIWKRHADDFLFAAAARLSLRRRRRRLNFILENGVLQIAASVFPFLQNRIQARFDHNVKRTRIGDANLAYFEHVARSLIRCRLRGRTDQILDLLDRINDEFHPQA